MKKILVPTDFSACAENALEYAIAMANAFAADVKLLNTILIPTTAGSFRSIRHYVEDDSEKGMQKLMNKYQGQLQGGASLTYEILEGGASELIAKVAQQYDLVIMGTQGASGFLETFIGSTANAVIQSSETPVLVIPNEAKFKAPQRMVFAVDTQEIATLNSLKTPFSICRQFNTHLYVFHLEEGIYDPGIDPLASEVFDTVDWSFNYEISSQSIKDSIDNYVEEKQADMLCMIRRNRGFWGNLFHVSTTRREAFESKIPLLIIHEN